MRFISVVPYDPKWKNEFERIKNELLPYISDLIISIEHVGSTSVPGLYAKPIIDIDIVINADVFECLKERLTEAGYFHIGNLGIEGREAFNYKERSSGDSENPPRRYLDKSHLMEHNLYVCDKDSDELKRHLTLRDFLRRNEKYRQKYGDIKIEMAKAHPHDIDSYILGKESVILEIYDINGLDISYKGEKLL